MKWWRRDTKKTADLLSRRVSSFDPYDSHEFRQLATDAWNICRQASDRSLGKYADKLLARVLSADTTPGTRLRLMTLLNTLSSTGFRAAAIARDTVRRESQLVRELDARLENSLQWVPLMGPEQHEEHTTAIIRQLQVLLSQKQVNQVLVCGHHIWRFVDEWADALGYSLDSRALRIRELKSELHAAVDHEVIVFPTVQWPGAIHHLAAIRTIIERSPLSKRLYIARLVESIPCPWFPLLGPPSPLTNVFPATKQSYSACLVGFGMSPWDILQDTFAVDVDGSPAREYQWCVFGERDGHIGGQDRGLFDAAQSYSDRARALRSISHSQYQFARDQQFPPQRNYTGSLEHMLDAVDDSVRTASLTAAACHVTEAPDLDDYVGELVLIHYRDGFIIEKNGRWVEHGRAREIGEQINDAGGSGSSGLEAMRTVAYRVVAICGQDERFDSPGTGTGATVALDTCWDGIGEWRR